MPRRVKKKVVERELVRKGSHIGRASAAEGEGKGEKDAGR